MSRFSTTYSSSYRPYSVIHSQINRSCPSPIADLPKSNQNPGDDKIEVLSRSANAWPVDGTLRSAYHTSQGVDQSSGSVMHHRWEDNQSADNNNISISNKHRLKRFNLCDNMSFTPSLNNPLNVNAKPSTSIENKKNYTSTFTTLVSDKLNFCPTPTYEDKKCETMAQTNAIYCLPRPRTLRAVAPLFNPPSVLDKSTRFSNDDSGKLGAASQTRTITLLPNSLHANASHIDFHQMFNQIARINNHLYLSSLNAITSDRLKQYGITLLVSAMMDSPPTHLRNCVSNTLHIPVEDIEGANLRVYFDRVTDRIAAESRRGGKALVHCIAGVSRSSTLVLAYLIRHMNMSLADAYHHVRTIRPCIQPNPGFWRQLLDYEEHVHGNRSVQLVPSLVYRNGNSAGTYKRGQAYLNSNPIYSDIYNRSSTSDILSYRPVGSNHISRF